MHSVCVAELHATVNDINKTLSEAQQCFYGKLMPLPKIKYTQAIKKVLNGAVKQ